MTFSSDGFSATGVDVQTIAEGRQFGLELTNPVIGGMTIRVTPPSGKAREYQRFLSYEYNQDFLSPSDSSSFDLAERELSNEDVESLVLGAKVELLIDNIPQSTSILDDVESTVDKGAGSIVRLSCRDWLSPVIDSQISPKLHFKENQTLDDVLTAVFGDFGGSVFATDNAANRNIITGRTYGAKTTKKGKLLKSYVMHEESPYPNEGSFAFASRVSQRFGLWIWPSADGQTVIVGKPDFDELPRYGLQHVYGTGAFSNNIERGTFKKSRQEQPSILFASGFGGGGNFEKSRLRGGIVNPIVDADNSKTIAAYPGVPFVTVPAVTAAFPPFIEGVSRPAFLYDPESHTQDQLSAFLLRELSLRMRKALTARYEFMGHKINGQPVAVDTIMNLNDQRPSVRWSGPLWVLGRRFSKSPREGTRTTLEMILPGSLVF